MAGVRRPPGSVPISLVIVARSPSSRPGATRAASARARTALAAIGNHDVTIAIVLSHELETIADVDTVVIRTNGLPDDALYHALDGKVPELVRIGDAIAVRVVDRAVYDGHVAARAL